MPHSRNNWHAILLIASCVFISSGCKPTSNAPVGAVVESPHTTSYLDQNGVLKSGWWVSIDDGDVDQWTTDVFADANRIVRDKLRAIFPNEIVYPIEVRIVPEFSGYEILVLSHAKLSKPDEEKVRLSATEAVTEAHATWVAKRIKKAQPDGQRTTRGM